MGEQGHPAEQDGAVSLTDFYGLEGKVAAVTGGGSGIGLAAAQALAAAGAEVVILDRAPVGEDVLASVRGAHRAEALVMDVTDEAEVTGRFAEIVARHGHIDILVNNAGLAIRDAAVDLSLEA